MPGYVHLKPEVAGGLGSETVMDTTVHPPRVSRLHYEVVDWLGDCIVQTFPCYLVLRSVGDKLAAAGFSGFHLTGARVTESDEFRDINPDGELPDLVWLVVDGVAGQDDIGLASNARLVVANSVFELFRAEGYSVGISEPWEAS